MNGPIIKDRTTNPKIALAMIAILAFAGLLWCFFTPYERIVLSTERCSLTQQKLDDGTTYLAKEYFYAGYYDEKPLLVLNFIDEKGRFVSEQYCPKDGQLVILDDDDRTEAYLEVETWAMGKVIPLTGRALFIREEHVQPMKLYIHESELLKLENGTVEERALKQCSNLVGTEYLAVKKDSKYIFNIEEKGWEFVKGDFSGVEGDDLEVIILESPDEPAYVEGEIRVGRASDLGLPGPSFNPAARDDHMVHAVFEPTKICIHESEIVGADNVAPEPTPEPSNPAPTPSPEPDRHNNDSNDIPDAGVNWGRNDDSGPGPDTNRRWNAVSQSV